MSQTRRRGTVASFGNAGGHELNTSVFPFILRGVRLVGIDSNTCPNDRRRRAWRRLGSILTEEDFEAVTSRTITLDEIPSVSQDVLSGDVRGRVVVDVQG
jgi:acrylyl-CoA reductase (NADPH)